MAKALGPEAFASGDLWERIEGKGRGVKGGVQALLQSSLSLKVAKQKPNPFLRDNPISLGLIKPETLQVDIFYSKQNSEISSKFVDGQITETLPKVFIKLLPRRGRFQCPVWIDKIQILMELQREIVKAWGVFTLLIPWVRGGDDEPT